MNTTWQEVLDKMNEFDGIDPHSQILKLRQHAWNCISQPQAPPPPSQAPPPTPPAEEPKKSGKKGKKARAEGGDAA